MSGSKVALSSSRRARCRALAAVGLLWLAACGGREDPVVLEVGEEKVSRSAFQLSFWEYTRGDTTIPRDTSGVRAFLEVYLKKELMEQLAAQHIPRFDDAMEGNWEAFRENLLRRLLDQQVLGDAMRVPEGELREAYEKLKTQFQIREIRLKSQQKAEQVAEVLAQGGVFAKVAGLENEDPKLRESEGDRGWVTLGQIPPPVYDAAARLRVGEVSPIIRSALGFHIIQLEGRRPTGEVRPYEEAREVLERVLRQERVAQEELAFRDELKRRYEFTLNPDNIIWLANWLRDATARVPRGREAFLQEEPPPVSLPALEKEQSSRIVATTTQDTLRALHVLVQLSRYPMAAWPTFESPEDVIHIVESLGVEWMRVAEARRRGLDRDEKVLWLAAKKRDAIHTRQFYLRHVRPEAEPTEEMVRRYYEEHPEQFLGSEQRRFLTYHLKSHPIAEGVAERLRAGEDPGSAWQWARAQDSLASWSGGKGTRFFARGQSQYLDSILFALERGEVSDPISHPAGYTVAQLLEIQPPQPIPFEQVKDRIRADLWNREADRRLEELLAAARDTIPIRIHEEALAGVQPHPPRDWKPPKEIVFAWGGQPPEEGL